ncbi:MAG: phosphoribosyl-AMP cyclohydrolase [Balneolaceae bacterium]
MKRTSFKDRQGMSKKQIEFGPELAPEFDEHGLVPCITVDTVSGEVLMFAWMNRESLAQTLETGKATYFSRSRGKLWVKGEVSGRAQRVDEIRVDCDQDVIQIRVTVDGDGGTCHNGYRSCFYRSVSDRANGSLAFIGDGPVFDPEDVY